MKKIIQVHIFKGDEQYVAECLDLPVVTQGKTLDELARSLQEALALHAIYRQAQRYLTEDQLRPHFYTD